MKKFFVLTAAAVAFGATVANAYPPPQLLDDSAAFTIARAVKLGDSDGDYGTAPTVSATKKTNLKKNDCQSDSGCSSSQKCSGGKCVDVCTSSTCSGETPDCSADNHKSACKCTDNSCGSGKKCSDGQCVSCSVGDKCGCSGAQVIVSGGQCGCPASTTCPAGQYKTDDCSCRNCLKDDTYNRCGCAAPLVPNGSGSCYCKETTCAAGNSFSTSACGCVPCTDNASCQYPCANGTPNGSGGCTPYVCTDDDDCGTGYYCANPSTANAACEQTVCAENQYFNGTTCRYCAQDYGPCSKCDATQCLECSGSYTAGLSSCDTGKMLVQTGVCGMCINCPKGQKCNCPDGKVGDGNGGCVSENPTTCEELNGSYYTNTGSWSSTCSKAGGVVKRVSTSVGYCFTCGTACPANCATCDDKGTCTVCASGYELKNGACVEKATSCTYASKNACMMDTGTNCTTDSKGCYVKGTTCVSGYWWGNVGVTRMDSCHPCPANSVSGSCSENKVTCKTGYVLKGGYVCTQCATSCGTCSDAGPAYCLTCASGYYTFARRSESSPGFCCKGKYTSNITECQYN